MTQITFSRKLIFSLFSCKCKISNPCLHSYNISKNKIKIKKIRYTRKINDRE